MPEQHPPIGPRRTHRCERASNIMEHCSKITPKGGVQACRTHWEGHFARRLPNWAKSGLTSASYASRQRRLSVCFPRLRSTTGRQSPPTLQVQMLRSMQAPQAYQPRCVPFFRERFQPCEPCPCPTIGGPWMCPQRLRGSVPKNGGAPRPGSATKTIDGARSHHELAGVLWYVCRSGLSGTSVHPPGSKSPPTWETHTILCSIPHDEPLRITRRYPACVNNAPEPCAIFL